METMLFLLNENNHWNLSFYPIWINLVPKYCAIFIYYDNFSKRYFDIFSGQFWGQNKQKYLIRRKNNIGGGGPLEINPIIILTIKKKKKKKELQNILVSSLSKSDRK